MLSHGRETEYTLFVSCYFPIFALASKSEYPPFYYGLAPESYMLSMGQRTDCILSFFKVGRGDAYSRDLLRCTRSQSAWESRYYSGLGRHSFVQVSALIIPKVQSRLADSIGTNSLMFVRLTGQFCVFQQPALVSPPSDKLGDEIRLFRRSVILYWWFSCAV